MHNPFESFAQRYAPPGISTKDFSHWKPFRGPIPMEPVAFDYQPEPPERGHTDRILMVDLSEMRMGVRTVTPEERELYLGGRGYCLWQVWDGTEPGTRWDDPSNVLVMAGGLLGGEPGWPGSGKFIVGTISPLTGSFIDSNVGGHFAPLMKFSGFDAVAVTGRAERPVVVVVDVVVVVVVVVVVGVGATATIETVSMPASAL